MKSGPKGPRITEKILDAAIICFATDGYHGSTTKAICARAGCTENSLYRLFGSKEKLFDAALRRAFEGLSRDDLAQVVEVLDRIARRNFRLVALGCLEKMTAARAVRAMLGEQL
jgi:AcrR family transcriptional regulator